MNCARVIVFVQRKRLRIAATVCKPSALPTGLIPGVSELCSLGNSYQSSPGIALMAVGCLLSAPSPPLGQIWGALLCFGIPWNDKSVLTAGISCCTPGGTHFCRKFPW